MSAQEPLIMSCTPDRKFEVLDCVFGFGLHEHSVWKGPNPELAFQGAKQQLAEACRKLGGDAVIACQFTSDAAYAPGSGRQDYAICAFGTAVRFLD
jgi:hypothetical protein